MYTFSRGTIKRQLDWYSWLFSEVEYTHLDPAYERMQFPHTRAIVCNFKKTSTKMFGIMARGICSIRLDWEFLRIKFEEKSEKFLKYCANLFMQKY